MPPLLTWFTGRDIVAEVVAANLFIAPGALRLLPVTANGQDAFAVYQRAADGCYRAHAIIVLELSPAGIGRMTAFQRPSLFARFGLPPRVHRGRTGLPAAEAGRDRGGATEPGAGAARIGGRLRPGQRRAGHCPALVRAYAVRFGWDVRTLLAHLGDSIAVLHQSLAGPAAPDPDSQPGCGADPVAVLQQQAARLLAGCAGGAARPSTGSPSVAGR